MTVNQGRAYGKAGNGNEMETGNGNWKWKLEIEMNTKNAPFVGALSSWTPWSMASVYDGLYKSCALPLLLYSAL